MVRTIAKKIEERPRHGALNVSCSDDEGEDLVIEHPKHPFFIGMLFVPQAQSTSGKPHPLVAAFVKTVIGRAT
jgi:CTP synthase (UTP-ammonia lyase)